MIRQVLPVSLVIPTYGREEVLVDTICRVTQTDPAPAEILVVDQTPVHDAFTVDRLTQWSQAGTIRWLHRDHPSIPAAMNQGLREASHDIVLFLDDDVVPDSGLVQAHLRNYQDLSVAAVVGQVLQPGEHPTQVGEFSRDSQLRKDLRFPFSSTQRATVANVMAGNLSVRRERAIQCGGFDENFVGVAYRFETEFCRRLGRSGGVIVFDPSASLRHLAAPRGGTRSYGRHLTTARPEHSVGDFYFAMREGRPSEALSYSVSRLMCSVCTRFHLTHPWWIPAKLTGEIRGLIWALQLIRRGPKYLEPNP